MSSLFGSQDTQEKHKGFGALSKSMNVLWKATYFYSSTPNQLWILVFLSGHLWCIKRTTFTPSLFKIAFANCVSNMQIIFRYSVNEFTCSLNSMHHKLHDQIRYELSICQWIISTSSTFVTSYFEYIRIWIIFAFLQCITNKVHTRASNNHHVA